MRYELSIDFDDEEAIANGFYLHQFVEADTFEEAVSILMAKAPKDTKLVWGRDQDNKVLYFAGKSDDSFDFQLEPSSMQRAFESILPEWPPRINVSDKQWAKDGVGCYIPDLSRAWSDIEQHFENPEKATELGIDLDYLGLAVWFIYRALHDRAKGAEKWVDTQEVTFGEIEKLVIETYLGWRGEEPETPKCMGKA